MKSKFVNYKVTILSFYVKKTGCRTDNALCLCAARLH